MWPARRFLPEGSRVSPRSMAHMSSRDPDAMERLHRHDLDQTSADADRSAEVPLFAQPAGGAMSNAAREEMAMRSRASRDGGGLGHLPGSNAGREEMAMRSRGGRDRSGAAVDSGAAEA